MRIEDIAGAWRLREFRLTNAAGEQSRPWSDASGGLLCYTLDGFMSASMRSVTASKGTVRFMSYCGPFDLFDDHVVHHIEMSSDEVLVGTDQRRGVRLDGRTMTLTASPSLFGGEGTSADLLWQRVDA